MGPLGQDTSVVCINSYPPARELDVVNRHEFLKGLHQAVVPRTYLEIGVSKGRSLTLSRTRTIGVDPAFSINVEVACDLHLVRATSDDFFARPDAMAWFPSGVIDLSLIDGLHVFEFAFRDFINAERHSTPTSVAVFDDMLPRSVAEAARDRYTAAWAGDVYKVATVLARYRPDLVVIPVDTQPTGVVVVVGLDPSSTVLTDHYDAILAEYANPDPQSVPAEILNRSEAADPEKVLASPIWAELVAARAVRGAPPESTASLRELRSTATYVSKPPPDKPWAGLKKAKAGGKRRRD